MNAYGSVMGNCICLLFIRIFLRICSIIGTTLPSPLDLPDDRLKCDREYASSTNFGEFDYRFVRLDVLAHPRRRIKWEPSASE